MPRAVSTGRDVEQVGPETSLQYEGLDPVSPRRLADGAVGLRQQRPRQHPEAGAHPSAGRRRHGHRRADRSPRRTPTARCSCRRQRRRCWCARTSTTRGSGESSTSPRPASRRPCRSAARSPISARLTPGPTCRRTSKEARRRRSCGCRPATRGPIAAGGWSRTRTSAGSSRTCRTLDLGDRRTGSGRSRASIQAFFRNGARARGWVNAGADSIPNNADDILIATGETLLQVQDRVLGVGVNSSSLFTAVQGFGTFGVRTACQLRQARADRRLREPQRRELPRHQLGRRRARAWRLGEVRGAVLRASALSQVGQVAQSPVLETHTCGLVALVASSHCGSGCSWTATHRSPPFQLLPQHVEVAAIRRAHQPQRTGGALDPDDVARSARRGPTGRRRSRTPRRCRSCRARPTRPTCR